jgi:putative transposase
MSSPSCPYCGKSPKRSLSVCRHRSDSGPRIPAAVSLTRRANTAWGRTIPGSTRTRVVAEILRDWLKAYRHGGFDALFPKPRADRGQSRSLPPEVADVPLAIKEGNPALSVQLVVREARTRKEVPDDLPLLASTVHRLLARHGPMDKAPGNATEADRHRFAFARAGELWMSDVMHGPSVLVGERTKRKTFPIAFIDDATRVIPYAAFALAESTRAFQPVLKQAIPRRGLPARLCVDNGANYRSHQLALVCAKPGIALIHARPYQPQGKGKIERWLKTVRGQLLTRLGEADTASLAALNRRLHVWVEAENHHTPPSRLGGCDAAGALGTDR